MCSGRRRPETMNNNPLPGKAFPLGFGPLFGSDPRARSPAFPLEPGPLFNQKPPRTANEAPQSGPRTAHRGPESNPRPPAEAPKVAQDHPQRHQERSKTARRGLQSFQDRPQGTRPPLAGSLSCLGLAHFLTQTAKDLQKVPRAAQDCPQRLHEGFKSAYRGPRATKTAHRCPKRGPRPPAQSQERPKTSCKDANSGSRPLTEARQFHI